MTIGVRYSTTKPQIDLFVRRTYFLSHPTTKIPERYVIRGIGAKEVVLPTSTLHNAKKSDDFFPFFKLFQAALGLVHTTSDFRQVIQPRKRFLFRSTFSLLNFDSYFKLLYTSPKLQLFQMLTSRQKH